MKTMKKLASLALALIMILALSAPAFAAEPTGSIKITDTAVGQTYHAYRLLDLKTYADTTPDTPKDGQYLYVVNSEWSEFFATSGPNGGASYVIINNSPDYENSTYVTWKTGEDPAGLAAAANLWIKGGRVDGVTYPSHSVTPVADATSTSAGATFTNLDLGYYLIDSTVGTTCFLDTTNPHVEIAEKNELPTVTKKIVVPDKDSATPGATKLVDTTTASYGDTITFQLNIKYPSALNTLTINDTMDASLVYVTNSAEVLNLDGTPSADYALDHTENWNNGTFDLNRVDPTNDEAPGDVIVTYEATLSTSAVPATALTNSVNLVYVDGANDKTTTTSTVTVYTYEFSLVKTTSDDTVLPGATFQLFGSADGTEPIKVSLVDGNYVVDSNGTADIKAGNVTIKGLADGTYWLEETDAPDGYNKVADRIEFKPTIAVTDSEGNETGRANNKAIVTDNTYVSGGVRVVNLTGAEMPSTGGIGTTIFYIVGGLLVVGAVVLLVTRKRAGEEE